MLFITFFANKNYKFICDKQNERAKTKQKKWEENPGKYPARFCFVFKCLFVLCAGLEGSKERG